MVSFKDFFVESRFSDKEYYNAESPWRLTVDEYLKVSNKSGKFHPSDAYEPREHVIRTYDNPPIKDSILVRIDPNRGGRFREVEWIDSRGNKRVFGGLMDFQVGNPDSHTDFAYDWILSNASGEVKNIDKIIKYHFTNSPNYTIEKFPYKIESKDGVDYRYDKSDKTLIAFIGDNAVGMASDEWGAYLVQVDPKYRGKGIGAALAHLYLAINKKDSGGYTNKGYNMAIGVHKKAVKDALELGWYKRALKDEILSKQKIKEIANIDI